LHLEFYLLKYDPALLERHMRFGPRTETRPSQKLIMAFIIAMFAALLIVPGLDHRFGWSRVPTAIVLIANLLILGQLVFSSWCSARIRFAASTVTRRGRTA
jgi:protein-S-isoprenylcysteine O-methyltransferase Ste14